MFKRRYLLIFTLVILLVIVSSMIFLRGNLYGAYTVCRNELPSGDGWKYLRTSFYTDGDQSFTIYYVSETTIVGCHFRYDGSEWKVLLLGSSLLP